jgi:hypothetical protein
MLFDLFGEIVWYAFKLFKIKLFSIAEKIIFRL